ncbi:hypothetical protein K488DRAFT_86266 [Vararia minispora EC-137]|uniref:Uncharacterized protein n=1 Tax=Vararia minispora EC-137 TaxID=1314806 RepID=A0ACB8QK01_9AGAM|nr:hypothetical protein K488DRAFT_86266 [Vararia minispora EC-137]
MSTRQHSHSLSLSHPQSPSHIPVIAPKPVKSSLPSAISAPQLGLSGGSSGRYPAVGDSPSHPTSPSASGSKSSGLPTLKSLRSLLPFGSGANANANGGGAASSPSPKNPFPSFASAGRRSLATERKTSGTFLRPSPNQAPVAETDSAIEDARVIAIEASPRQRRDGISLKTSPVLLPSTLPSDQSSCSVPVHSQGIQTDSFVTPASRHAPETPLRLDFALDDGRTTENPAASGHASRRLSFEGPHDTPTLGSPATIPSPEPSPNVQSRLLELPSIHAPSEPLLGHELSTILESDLSGMSKHLPASSDTSRDSPETDDGEDATARHGTPFRLDRGFVLPARTPPASDVSLELSTSDLRNEVMSAMEDAPHRASWLDPCEVEDVPDSRSASAEPEADASFGLDTLDPDLAALLSPHRLPVPVPSSPPPPASPPGGGGSSLGYESSPAKPRASRVVRPTLAHASTSTPSLPRAPRTDRTSPLRNDRFRASSDTFLPGSIQRGNEEGPSLSPPPSLPLTLDVGARRLPPRRGALYNPARLFRSAVSSATAHPTSPRRWEAESTSPSSRASSALGRRMPTSARPSLDEPRRPSLNLERERTFGPYVRTRNRSLSVDDPSLGPSTAKAFAAAGVLDRFGSVRGRLAMSDAGSGSAGSWRSVSRAMTASEMGVAEWAGSTAPTSVSGRASSPGGREREKVREALGREREKHAVEMGALLAALADSQRAATALREDNAELRARIDDLEAELVRAKAQLRAATAARVPPTRERTPVLLARPDSADGMRPRRVQPRASPRESPGERTYRFDGRGHRAGTLSMHEGTLNASPISGTASPYPSRSVSPLPSRLQMTHELPVPVPPPPQRAETSSPTATSASATGSPRSLFLRPEQEMLLDEMPSLEMRMPDSEYEDEDEAG